MTFAHPSHWAEVDIANLHHNYAVVRRRLRRKKLIGSVKADAYGHGAVRIAQELAALGVDALTTGSPDEALAIRRGGVRVPIIMLGCCPPGELPDLARAGLLPTITDLAGARVLAGAMRYPTAVYVKVDCGLGRLGIPLADAPAAIRAIAAQPPLVVAGIYTHLPFHDAAGREWARAGLARFDHLLRALAEEGVSPAITQARASAGLFADLEDAANSVCAGHALYGFGLTDAAVAGADELRPALRAITTRLIHLADQTPGTRQGAPYGHSAARRTGVIPIGTADGLRRPPEGRPVPVVVRGHRVRLIGVSLEHAVVDLDEAPEAAVGDAVSLLGEGVTLAELAALNGVTEREVLMQFARRITYRYGRSA
ncbi:MAG: alanine racemase [Alphaproteobacteria bacterium]|nr:alanine racemase [Alphaproteobacteria bacterium]